jgi:hypothetical protein
MVDKLKLSTKKAHHTLRIIRQKLQRRNDAPAVTVVDLSDVNVDGEEINTDLREELSLLQERHRVEDDRMRRLVHGCGKGRPKSPAFEFAARTILATGIKFTFCCTFLQNSSLLFTYPMYNFRLFCAGREGYYASMCPAIFSGRSIH